MCIATGVHRIRDPPAAFVGERPRFAEPPVAPSQARKESPMVDSLKPKDSVEAVAVFRAQVIGSLMCRDPESHGELADALRQLAGQPVRPPGRDTSRRFSVPTLERWYYAFKARGLDGLKPKGRTVGFALRLEASTRELLLQIRREHPRVSTALILRTLERDGRLQKGAVSQQTLRRLYAAHGLDRQHIEASDQPRRRWETAAPNLLWHTDVCHGPALRIDGKSCPLRVHALLDDHSRYIVAIQACATERETEMLALTVKALRLHGCPNAMYTDNGPTYVGDALATLCSRLGIGLLHAKPYDPQARGKMERFWRTLREQCLDHVGDLASLHDVQVRLLAWLDRHYHVTSHSSLMGKTPAEVYETGRRKPVDDIMLREALIVHGKRRIRRLFEIEQAFLSGRLVTIARSLLDPSELPWVEHEDQRHVLRHVAPRKNAERRKPRLKRGIDALPFDPPGAWLADITGRKAPR
jgi:putative transposase